MYGKIIGYEAAILTAALLLYFFALPVEKKIQANNSDLGQSSTSVKVDIKKASRINLRVASFALSLNPLKMADVESRQVATLLHAGLVFQNDNGVVIPMLASEWKRSVDGWEFTLKGGVTFSDGTLLKATDVVSSICQAMQPSSPWGWALKSIVHESNEKDKSVRCIGLSVSEDGKVIIKESYPSSSLLDALSGPAGWVLPENSSESAYGVIPGIGPYVVKDIVADSYVSLKARAGGVIKANVNEIRFNYLPDDSMAASHFLTGRLDVLDLNSPRLVEIVMDPQTALPRNGGGLNKKKWDRIRVVIVNEKRLQERMGLSPEQSIGFVHSYASLVDRESLEKVAKGIAEKLTTPFPPVSTVANYEIDSDVEYVSNALTLITESDAFSDLIAAMLPTNVGNITVDYKGVDKAVLIDSLIKGEFDLASIVIEATTHSASFWKSFFEPGSAYTVFGKGLDGLDRLNHESSEDLQQIAAMIFARGNWVPLLREKRIQVTAPKVGGVLFSASGQTNFIAITKK